MQELVKAFNIKRKANKNKWIWTEGLVNDKPVVIKSYNTWIQFATFCNKRDGGPMDCSVKVMNDWLSGFLLLAVWKMHVWEKSDEQSTKYPQYLSDRQIPRIRGGFEEDTTG